MLVGCVGVLGGGVVRFVVVVVLLLGILHASEERYNQNTDREGNMEGKAQGERAEEKKIAYLLIGLRLIAIVIEESHDEVFVLAKIYRFVEEKKCNLERIE